MADIVKSETIQAGVLPVELRVFTLSTGLTVALVPIDSPGLVACYTAMRVGSRDELEPGHSGFAHLFEHMMFRGTKNMPGDVYDKKVQALGADSSAWTWYDQTVYFLQVPTRALDEVIAMEAERFQNLSYPESVFKTESGAVLGEYNKNFSDPSNQLEEDLVNLAFEKSTYKHTTMGFLEDIRAMPGMFEYSLKFLERHYAPSKAILFIVGDFDEARVMKRIRTEYAGWDRPGEQVVVPIEPEQTAERRMHRRWKNPVLPRMLVGYKAPAYDNARRDLAALTLIGEMLFGSTGDLHTRLVLDEQVVEDFHFWDHPHRDPFLWVYEVTFKDEQFERVLGEVDKALKDVIQGRCTQERLDAVKSHYLYGFMLQLRTPGRLAGRLSYYATLDGDPASADRFLARVEEVTLEDLKRVAGRYLVETKRTVVTLAYPGGES